MSSHGSPDEVVRGRFQQEVITIDASTSVSILIGQYVSNVELYGFDLH